jgi:hypothetical protein
LCHEAAENAVDVVLDDIALDGRSFRPPLGSRFSINVRILRSSVAFMVERRRRITG